MSDQAPAPTSEPQPAQPTYRLVEVDRNLAPIRRVLSWLCGAGIERLTDNTHLESNVEPWLQRLDALALPDAIAETVTRLRKFFAGYDQLCGEEQWLRVHAAAQELTRLDASCSDSSGRVE